MPKKRIAAVLIVMAAAASAFYFWRNRERPENGRIRISGNIELTEVGIAFKTPGRLVELAVEEGEQVEKGAVVARLDKEDLLSQRQREQATLEAARSELVQLTTAIQYQEASLAAEIDQRQAQVREAEFRLQQLESGTRSQEIEQARAGVVAAQSQAERAARDWERAQRLYKNEDISTAQFDDFRARHETAQASLKQARERLELALAGPRKEEIQAASAQVAQARAALRQGEAARLEVKRKRQEIDTRNAEIARARAQIEIVESHIADTVASSPIAGTVLVKSAEAGEVVGAGTPVVTIGDLARPWLRGYIGERDLGRVKLGTPVEIVTDSYPGKVYRGRVSFISPEAEFTPRQIQTQEERVKLVYRIKVDVENPHRELKSNMPADAVILTAEP